MVKERIESTPTLSLYTQGVEVRGEGLGVDIQELFQDLESLSPRDRVNATLKLMEFVLPKLSSVSTQESNLKDMVQDLTKIECADLIDQIIEQYGED